MGGAPISVSNSQEKTRINKPLTVSSLDTHPEGVKDHKSSGVYWVSLYWVSLPLAIIELKLFSDKISCQASDSASVRFDHGI